MGRMNEQLTAGAANLIRVSLTWTSELFRRATRRLPVYLLRLRGGHGTMVPDSGEATALRGTSAPPDFAAKAVCAQYRRVGFPRPAGLMWGLACVGRNALPIRRRLLNSCLRNAPWPYTNDDCRGNPNRAALALGQQA